MVPLMTLLASCDTGMCIWHYMSQIPVLQLILIMVTEMMSLASHAADANDIKLPKLSCCISFQ